MHKKMAIVYFVMVLLVFGFLFRSFELMRCQGGFGAFGSERVRACTDLLRFGFLRAHERAILYFNRAGAFTEIGDSVSAMNDANASIRSEGSYENLINSASVGIHQNKYDEAIDLYSRAIKMQPRRGEAYYGRSRAYYFLGDYARAMSDANLALEINPCYSEVLNDRGLINYKTGNRLEATKDFELAIKCDPKNHRASENLRAVLDDKTIAR